jgi:RNA polymerase sigma-70 factor (ECF subfamily)
VRPYPDEPHPVDLELVLRMQQGDLDALGGIYDRHRQLVFRTALAITGDQEAAADLLQEVFLRLYRFADRIDPYRPLEPWLYRMTANMAYTWASQRRRWYRLLQEMAERLARDGRPTPYHLVEQREQWGEVQRALEAISPEKRVVVVLYYLNGLSLAEIAEALELPLGTVKSRLHYGRKMLKKSLALEGDSVNTMGYEAT